MNFLAVMVFLMGSSIVYLRSPINEQDWQNFSYYYMKKQGKGGFFFHFYMKNSKQGEKLFTKHPNMFVYYRPKNNNLFLKYKAIVLKGK